MKRIIYSAVVLLALLSTACGSGNKEASELPQIKGGDMDAVCTEIQKLIGEYGIEKIVLGYPKNMNGTIGPRGELSEQLKALLEEKTGIPVILWDERLTTVSATAVMNTANIRGKKRKNRLDSLSAALILENYLHTLS